MSEKGNALSRNPNLCASCSSLSDGMEEPDPPRPSAPLLDLGRAPETLENFLLPDPVAPKTRPY